MLTRDQVFTFVFDLVRDETGLTTIKANQKGPRPARPYASVMFLNPSSQMAGVEWTMDGNSVLSEGMNKAVASIHVFGDGAVDILARFRDSLSRPDIVEKFEVANISDFDTGPINDLTAVEETDYLEHAQLDLPLGFVAGSSTDVGTIEHVEITGTVNGHSIVTSL